MTTSHDVFKLAVTIITACAMSSAWPAAYRCEVDGKTIYSDKPCSVGRQSEVPVETQGPSAEDRAAAAARLRNDKAEANAMQHEREKREQVAVRTGLDRKREVNACPKLAIRAKRAHEDYDSAGPREQVKKRVRMLRADEDYAALCRKR